MKFIALSRVDLNSLTFCNINLLLKVCLPLLLEELLKIYRRGCIEGYPEPDSSAGGEAA